MPWDARAPRVGEKAPDLELLDEAGRPVALSSVARRRPLVLIVFSGLHDEPGLELLRDYRDDTLALWRAGARICAVSGATAAQLRYLRSQRGYGFPLLADPGSAALSTLGLAGKDAVFLLDRNLVVHQRAPREAAAPDTVLSILRRGGARPRRRPLSARFADLGHAVQQALGLRRQPQGS
jgi:peroxiredoxin